MHRPNEKSINSNSSNFWPLAADKNIKEQLDIRFCFHQSTCITVHGGSFLSYFRSFEKIQKSDYNTSEKNPFTHNLSLSL